MKTNNDQMAFVSAREFAKNIGIAYSTIFYLYKLGKIKVYQDTDAYTWLIPIEEIERFRRKDL